MKKYHNLIIVMSNDNIFDEKKALNKITASKNNLDFIEFDHELAEIYSYNHCALFKIKGQ